MLRIASLRAALSCLLLLGSAPAVVHASEPHASSEVEPARTLDRRALAAPSLSFPDGWRWDLRNQSYTVRMEVKNNSSEARTICFSSSRQAGISGNVNNVTTGDPSVPGCQSMGAGETRMLSVGYTMANSNWDGDDLLAWVRAYDQGATSIYTDAYFKITVATAISSPPAESLQEGQAYTRVFRIYNQNPWGSAHTYNISVSAGSPLTNVSAPTSVNIPAHTWVDIPVSFTIPYGHGGKTAFVTVSASDANHPPRQGKASSQYTSVAVSANPSANWLSNHQQTNPGGTYTNTYRVKNNATSTRTLCFWDIRMDGNASASTLLSAFPQNPGCQSFAAGETKDIARSYTVAPNATAGSYAYYGFTAYDQEVSSYVSESAHFQVTLNTVVANPTVTPPANQSGEAGTSYTATFTVKNNSNVSRTFRFTPASSNTAVVGTPAAPANQTIAAFDTASVSVSVPVLNAVAGSAATVSLTATDTGDGTKVHSGSFTHTTATTIRRPSAAWLAAHQYTDPGAPQTNTYRVTNNSNTGRTLCFWDIRMDGNTSAATLLSAFPENPGCLAFAAFEQRDIARGYTMSPSAPAGGYAYYGFTAYDQADANLVSESAHFQATANTVVLSPSVTAPLGQTDTLGASRTVSFTVKNNSNVSRTFSFAATSSNTAVVLDPADPAGATIAAGGTASVPVTYQVVSTSAAAGSTATISLNATDTGDAAKTHSSGFTHTTATTLRKPSLVWLSAHQYADPGVSMSNTLRATNNSNTSRTLCARDIRMDGTASASTFLSVFMADPGCHVFLAFETKEVARSYTVSTSAVEGTYAYYGFHAYDQDSTSLISEGGQFQPIAKAYVANPTVTPPANQSGEAGTSYTATFTVKNNSNVSRTFSFTPASSDTSVVGAPAAPADRTIAAFDTASVSVSVPVLNAVAGSAATVSLTATDTGDGTKVHSGSFTHTTATTIRRPSAAWLAAHQYTDPGAPQTNTYRVTNNSNTGRTLCFWDIRMDGNTSAATLLSAFPENPGCLAFAAFEQRDIARGYTMSPSAPAGGYAYYGFTAYDQADANLVSESAHFQATANTVVLSPSVTAPLGQTDTLGASRTVSFTVKNNSNVSRTFSFAATSSNTAVVLDPADPAGIPIAAGADSTVLVTYSPLALGSAVVTLTATDTQDGTKTASQGFTSTVTGARDPEVSAAVRYTPVVLGAGGTYRIWFRVKSLSSETRSYYFTAADPSGDVTVVQLPPNLTLAAGEEQLVPLDVQVKSTITEGVLRDLYFAATDAGGEDYGNTQIILQVQLTTQRPQITIEGGGYHEGSAGQSKRVRVKVHNPRAETQMICLRWLEDEGLAGQVARPEPNAICPHVEAGGTAYEDFTYSFTSTATSGTRDRQAVQSYFYLEDANTTYAYLHTKTVASGTNQAPTASFSYTPTAPYPGDAITFDGTHSTDPDWDVLSYSWSFGDSTTATGPKPSKAYSAAGSYSATLTANDGRGGTHSSTQTVTVYADTTPPTITFNPLSGHSTTDAYLPVTIDWRDNRGLDSTSLVITLNGSTAGNFTTTWSGSTWAQSSTTILLQAGTNTLSASVRDQAGNQVSASATYTYNPIIYAVSVTPDGGTVQAAPNSSGSYSFVVANTGNQTTTYTLAGGCGDQTVVTSCTSAVPSLTLEPGVSMSVSVNYTTAASGVGSLGLSAHKEGDSSIGDTGIVDVEIGSSGGSIAQVSPQGATHTTSAGASDSYTFTVTNPGTTSATYTLSSVCSGQALNCSTPSSSTLTLDGGVSGTATVGFTAGTSGTGEVRLRAALSDGSTGEGWIVLQVPSGTPRVMEVALDSATSIPLIERDLCLSIAAGSAAAYECGDLRIAHALPTIRTMNKARTPVLLYNSQHASPFPLVAAELHLPANADVSPGTVEVTLTIPSKSITVRDQWSGSDWSPGQTRRVVIPADALTGLTTDITGVYAYELTVSAMYSDDGTWHDSPKQTGSLVVVDRRQSELGAGWWLAGLERIQPIEDGRLLWIGGDGSARVYDVVTSDAEWKGPALDRPDVIKKTATGGYERYLPHEVTVVFDHAGLHRATVNRLQHRTEFGYDASGRISRIDVPVPAGSTAERSYGFTYETGKVSIRAPGDAAIGDMVFMRTVEVGHDQGRVSYIRDPGTPTTQNYPAFEYDGTSNRISARTDRRLHRTSYGYNTGKRLERSTVHMAASASPDDITVLYQPQESKGVDSSVREDSVFTFVKGPRADVTRPDYVAASDTTVAAFWVDRFGAPWKIKDAEGIADPATGKVTTIYRNAPAFDAAGVQVGSWPALVGEVVHPNGRRQVATYDTRGNLRTSRDEGETAACTNDLTTLKYPETAYEWHQTWDFVEKITSPCGETTSFTYDANGNRDSHLVGTDATRKVTFQYYPDGDPAARMLKSTTLPNTPADLVQYEPTRGNLSKTTSPMEHETHYATDNIGRVTKVQTQVNKPASGEAKIFHEHHVVEYDLWDRELLTKTVGPAMNNVAQQTLWVDNDYDEEGNLRKVERWSDDGTDAIGRIATRWEYDRANRPVKEIAPDDTPGDLLNNPDEVTVYDRSGNIREVHTRRVNPVTNVRLVIEMQYDALNRLEVRTVPAVPYPRELKGIPMRNKVLEPLAKEPYPMYPNNGESYLIAESTSRFDYDLMGNLEVADNEHALVRRTYYKNGLLKSESQQILRASGGGLRQDPPQHTVRYTYDRNGRPLELHHPSALVSGAVRDRASYRYDPDRGDLHKVIDPMGNVFTYGYNLRGEVESLVQRAVEGGAYGVNEQYLYDLDGNLETHTADTLNASGTFAMHHQALTYDARGRVLTTRNSGANSDKKDALYSGLGHLLQHSVTSTKKIQNGTATYQTDEAFRYDALGNIFQNDSKTTETIVTEGSTGTSTTDSITRSSGITNRYQTATGRHQKAIGGRTKLFEYDRAGNTFFMTEELEPVNEDRASYYAADGQLRVVDHRSGSEEAGWRLTFEEYYYDALGRRTVVDTRRHCTNAGYLEPICRMDFVRRTVWDGSRELYEIQMPTDQDPNLKENDTGPVGDQSLADYGRYLDPNPFYGRAGYTHGMVLDRPLSITRIGYGDQPAETDPYREAPPFALIPLWNAQGTPLLATFGSGTAEGACATIEGKTRCVGWAGPETEYAYFRKQITPNKWMGTLLNDKLDHVGVVYRRNRYYDPDSGRFTQEDPIGLAGGINLYGFAGSDPVNFSDPFGLDCKDKDGSRRPCNVTWSKTESHNPDVEPEVSQEIQKLADAAEVDLTLNSGRRTGNCYLTSKNGRGSMHNCGLAVDISHINGVDVGQGLGPAAFNKKAEPLVRRLIGEALKMQTVREAIGPTGMWTSGKYGSPKVQFYTQSVQNIHYNHVHIGIHPQSTWK